MMPPLMMPRPVMLRLMTLRRVMRSYRVQRAIGVSAAEYLRFVIENPFDPESPSTRKNGIGLANVRNRLEARYGNAARLEIQVEKDRYRVTLSLPCMAKG